MCEKFINNNFRSFQQEVGGYIERVSLFDSLIKKNIDMYVDEEGLYKNNYQTTMVKITDETITDIIKGNVVFSGRADDGYDQVDLSNEQVDWLKSIIKEVSFTDRNGKTDTAYTLDTNT